MATPPVPPPVPGPNKLMTAPPAPGVTTLPPPPQPRPVGDMQKQPTIDETPGEDDDGTPQSFWQIPFVQDILPFVTSLLLHVGLIGLGILTYRAAQVMVSASKEPVIIPDATIIENAEVGGIPHPGLGGDETRDAAQDKFKDIPPDSTGIADKPSTSLQMALVGGGGGDNDDSTIAVGASSGAFGRGTGTGIGSGTGVGSGTGDGGGPLAPFGIPGGGGGIGPKSPFMGVSGNAMKVVYLCDSSGSMMNKFDTLRQELRKAADTLKPIQSFDIIFFSEDSFVALDKQLMLATPEVKRKAYDFLDKTAPHGSSDPIPGLKAAFATQPQLIYMLTDGDFPNNAQMLEELRKLNKDKKVKINTIAFMDRGEEYEKLLKQIADENGGLFKFVSDSELQK
ncbi:MAG: hypothetical protein JWN40_2749 [Phycisphaerales bacterium]|nr:hypothetical protein [Phycisphaerales bacterium]